MYHLFVSGAEDAWNGLPWEMDSARCINQSEYTDQKLVERFGACSPEQVAEMARYPCVFAYEGACKLDARLGWLIDVKKRPGAVRVRYEFDPVYPPITHEILDSLRRELDVAEWELSRTHWAIKEEDLSAALASRGLPPIHPHLLEAPIDIYSQDFDVGLSFPGEVRDYVEQVAFELAKSLGKQRIFYDNFYKAQLARPNLDTALQQIYRDRCRLLVAFLSKDYAEKKWCGIEFRAIREIINAKKDERVMFVRHDKAEVSGVFSTDGYIDAATHTPKEVATMIQERLSVQPNNRVQNLPTSQNVKQLTRRKLLIEVVNIAAFRKGFCDLIQAENLLHLEDLSRLNLEEIKAKYRIGPSVLSEITGLMLHLGLGDRHKIFFLATKHHFSPKMPYGAIL